MQKRVERFVVTAIFFLLSTLVSALNSQPNRAYAQAGYGNTAPLTTAPTAVPTAEQQVAEPPTAEQPNESCPVTELDQKAAFQNGTGYITNVNNCSILYFSTTENGKNIKYAILANGISSQGANLIVAGANDTKHALARFTLTPGAEKVVAPSSLATTSLRAKLISIDNQNKAKLLFARTSKKALLNMSSSTPKALILGILAVAAVAIILFIILKRH